MEATLKLSIEFTLQDQLRPYTLENTGSRPISKVKLVMAQSVLWWGTTREYWVLKFFAEAVSEIVYQAGLVGVGKVRKKWLVH